MFHLNHIFRVYSGKFHEGKRIDSIRSDKRTGAR